jgi:hypothetical protein
MLNLTLNLGFFLILIFILSLFMAVSARAGFSELPSSMSFDYFGYKQMALGNLCYSMDGPTLGRPCHPARLADQLNSKGGASLEWGLGTERKSTAEKILDSKIDPELIADIFADTDPVLYSGGVEFYYQRAFWSFSFSPYKIWYYSHSRNPAFPVIDLHVLEEKDLQFQLGSALNSQMVIGTNIKLISRKFIHDSISFYDLLVDENSLTASEQKVLLLEPGLIWNPETETDLHPELSLLITNLGFQDKKYEGFSVDPTVHAGAALGVVKNDLQFKLALQADSQNPRERNDKTETWRAGTIIGNDWLDFTYSANKTEQSFGFLSKGKYFYSGIIYERIPERLHFNFMIEI